MNWSSPAWIFADVMNPPLRKENKDGILAVGADGYAKSIRKEGAGEYGEYLNVACLWV